MIPNAFEFVSMAAQRARVTYHHSEASVRWFRLPGPGGSGLLCAMDSISVRLQFRVPPANDFYAAYDDRPCISSTGVCLAKSSSRSVRARWVGRSIALRVSLSTLALLPGCGLLWSLHRCFPMHRCGLCGRSYAGGYCLSHPKPGVRSQHAAH